MEKTIKRKALLFSLAGLLSGCAVTLNATNLLDGYQKDNVEIAKTNPEACTGFAFRLFNALEKTDENTIFSPLSVTMALAMAENGAQNESLKQMEETLGLSLEELNATMLQTENQVAGSESLHLANSIWYNDIDDLEVEPAYLQTIRNYYEAQIYQEEFDPELTGQINAWVKEHTAGQIDSIIEEIPEEAIMYLVNAMAFESHWKKDYEEYQLTEGSFENADGSVSQVSYMHSEEDRYLENDHVTGFLKPYEDENYAFVALLPKSSLEEAAASLDEKSWSQLMEGMESKSVFTKMPKFEISQEISLKDALETLGMQDPFHSGTADFSKMATSDGKNIYISRILHKSFLSVFEQGTKAGATTAVEMSTDSAALEEPKRVDLDRPFLFALIDTRSEMPLFLGAVRILP